MVESQKGVSANRSTLFKPGQSGNPSGRPKGTGIKNLITAIEIFESEQKTSFWVEVIKIAFKNNSVLIALIRKLLPDIVENSNQYKIDGFIIDEDDEKGTQEWTKS